MASSSDLSGKYHFVLDEKVQKLLDAASSGNLRLLKEMARRLDKGKGIAETIGGVTTKEGLGVLHCAAEEGRTEICRYLIENLGFPVDLRSQKGGTALFYAAGNGRVAMVSYLIEQGADLVAPDEEGATPLHFSAEFGHVEVLKLLLSSSVPVDPENWRGTPLHITAVRGEESAMKILLAHGADVNKITYGMYTPLVWCIMSGRGDFSQCIQLLIEAGADLNLGSPLSMAVVKNNVDVLKCLLGAGSDPNIHNEHERLPIEDAALVNRKEIVEMLFPLTSPIPEVKSWSIEGIFVHVNSCPFRNKFASMMLMKFDRRLIMGEDAIKKKDFRAALLMYNGAAKIDSGHPILYAKRSLCYLCLGAADRALEDACMARSLRPDLPEAHIRVGDAFMSLENYKEASLAFLEGSILDPSNKDIKDALRNSLDCMRKCPYVLKNLVKEQLTDAL